jgi:hypothetical protein
MPEKDNSTDSMSDYTNGKEKPTTCFERLLPIV